MEYRPWIRRLAGWLRLSAWAAVLYLVASPWKDLGGIVDERLRWFHRFGLLMGMAAGAVAGSHGRDVTAGRGERCRGRWYRLAWYPLAAFTAGLMAAMAWVPGREGEIGVLLTGFLASWGGIDFGFTVFPLLHGRSPGEAADPDVK